MVSKRTERKWGIMTNETLSSGTLDIHLSCICRLSSHLERLSTTAKDLERSPLVINCLQNFSMSHKWAPALQPQKTCLCFSVYGENIYGHKMYSIKMWLVRHFFYKLRACGKLLVSIFQKDTTQGGQFRRFHSQNSEKERQGVLQTRRAIFKEGVGHSEQPQWGTSMER